jgi:hypothetical protein
MPLESAIVAPGCMCYRCSFCNKSFLMLDDGWKHEAKCESRANFGELFIKEVDEKRKDIKRQLHGPNVIEIA